MAANDAYSQQALAADPRFQKRLQSSLTKVAWQVLEEDPSTLHHAERADYAHTVNQNPQQTAVALAPSFVNRPNVLNFETSYNFQVGGTVTASGDPDIESQLMTDWNKMAGVTG
jgi:hypothetical protein